MPSKLKVRVAAVQAAPVGFDLPRTLSKVRQLVEEAASKGQGDAGGADLVVLPEAFCSAYPRHWGFAIGSRSDEQREWYGRYVKSAIAVPEDALTVTYLDTPSSTEGDSFWAFGQLCSIANSSKVYLSIGIIERSLVGSTLWCTNLLFSPSGQLLSKHRKLQPTAAERVVWSQGEATYPARTTSTGELAPGPSVASSSSGVKVEGDNMAVATTSVGRIGGLICWENFMPLARYVLYKKGVEIYTAPTADARPTWLPVMQHIAQEGRCYVVSANQYHTSQDFPKDYPFRPASDPTTTVTSQAANVWSRGGSCIIGPLGEVLAGPLWDQEGILYAELDMEKLHGARLDFDPTGHYAREELLMGMLRDLSA